MKLDSYSFLKSVSILLSGTLIAQLISVSLSPVISRYYGPEENAYLGLFLKITTLAATLFTARLELTLPLEKKNHYAFGIYQFSFRLSAILSLLTFAVIAVYLCLTSSSLEEILFLITIPIGIFAVSFFNLGNNWELRLENYGTISKANVTLSLTSNLLKIGGGIVSGHFMMLVGSTLIAYIASSIAFANRFLTEYKTKILSHRSKRTKLLIKSNKDFYTYNLFHVILDLTREMILATFLWIYFSREDFGSYEFSFRMMKLPIVLIATAMSQVFFRKAQKLLQQHIELKKMTYKTLLISILISLLPFAAIFLFGKEIFTFVFGDKWVQAGEIAEIIAPWMFVNFVFTPLSFIPILLNQQKQYFWLNMILFIIFIIFGWIAVVQAMEFNFFIYGLTFLQGGFLLLMILWFLNQIPKKTTQLEA